MRKSFELVKKRQQVNINRIPDIEERKRKLREVRERSVGNQKLLEKAVRNLEENGIRVIRANSGKDALSALLNEIGEEKVVVKSKSNLTKELNVTSFLESKGIDVIETDIGDRVIQICKQTPCHPTGPAVNLSSKYISEMLSRFYGKSIGSEPIEIVSALREDIREKIEKAKVGITGANSISAEGAILLVHNEGNIFKVIHRPEKWIIFAGIDKIYPSVDDALNAAKLQTFFATGSVLPSFIEIISGVSKTADIEKKLIKGVQEPKEVVLILIDNGRSKLINEGMNELFYCIGCGNCVIHCPSYSVYGEEFMGGRFALINALKNNASLEFCLTCGKCKQNCPVSIDIPSMIKNVRGGNEVYNFLISHLKWLVSAAYLESLLLYSKIFRRG